jgi:hypothetical protein
MRLSVGMRRHQGLSIDETDDRPQEKVGNGVPGASVNISIFACIFREQRPRP